MKSGVTVTGIVLSSMPIGEYDRRISLLTKELGKISVFAKGSRKPNGAFLAITQSFTFGEFTVFPGKCYTLIGTEVKNYFPEFREDLDAMFMGLYFCEMADYFAQEGQDEGELLKLLYSSLRALVTKKMPRKLIRAVYELRLITLEGEGPNCSECVNCGSRALTDAGEYVYFGLHEGGALCPDCATGDSLKIHTGTFYAMQHICSAPFEKLYSFMLEEDRSDELFSLVRKYLALHVDRKFRSEEMLS